MRLVFKKNMLTIFLLILLLLVSVVGNVNAEIQKPEMTLHLATTHPAEQYSGQSLIAFAKVAEELSEGRIKVIIHFFGELSSSERDYVDMIISGDLDLMYAYPGIFSAYGENYYEIFDLPLVFEDNEQALKFMYTDTMEKINQQMLHEFGFRPIGGAAPSYGKLGRVLGSNKPLESWEDLQGLSLRVSESPIYIKAYSALGIVPTPLPFGEVFTALQTKLIDATASPITDIVNQSFYEVAKYVGLFPVIGYVMPVCINGDLWESLSPEDQKILQEANTACLEARWSAGESAYKEETELLIKEGVQIFDLTDLIPRAKEIIREDMQDEFKKVSEKYDFLGYDIFDAAENPEKYGGIVEFKYYSPETWEPLTWEY